MSFSVIGLCCLFSLRDLKRQPKLIIVKWLDQTIWLASFTLKPRQLCVSGVTGGVTPCEVNVQGE
jgi:hypothetical protein